MRDPNHVNQLFEKLNTKLVEADSASEYKDILIKKGLMNEEGKLVETSNRAKWETFTGENELTSGSHLVVVAYSADTTAPIYFVRVDKRNFEDVYRILDSDTVDFLHITAQSID